MPGMPCMESSTTAKTCHNMKITSDGAISTWRVATMPENKSEFANLYNPLWDYDLFPQTTVFWSRMPYNTDDSTSQGNGPPDENQHEGESESDGENDDANDDETDSYDPSDNDGD